MFISYSDFEKIEIHVGKIIKVEEFPQAKKPAYKLWIDFGIWALKSLVPKLLNFMTKRN
jgi:tRNA-binding protein